jgi:hypothetical protein
MSVDPLKGQPITQTITQMKKKYITGTHKEQLKELRSQNKLNSWETNFVNNLLNFRKYSQKQQDIVERIFRKNNYPIPPDYTEQQIKELNSLYYDRTIIKNKQHMTSWGYKDRYSYRRKGKL